MQRWEKVELVAGEFMRELIRAGSIRCSVDPSTSGEPITPIERATAHAQVESAFLLAEEFVNECDRRGAKNG